jgi:hypothetical protein
MDTNQLIADSKARFSHNSAKAYLQDKYNSKLLVAEQGGLWKADTQTISFLNSLTQDSVILMDTFNNPVVVVRADLLATLTDTYTSVMEEWYKEWSDLEVKR